MQQNRPKRNENLDISEIDSVFIYRDFGWYSHNPEKLTIMNPFDEMTPGFRYQV